MGRGEWLSKASGGVDGGGGGQISPPAPATKPMNRKKIKDKNTSGCMSVIFNMFDVQHHQFRFHHPSFMPESTVDVASVSSKVKETNLKLPMGKIQIKTKQMTFTDELSECSNSPGTKTLNLVARLMGLDILPEYSSPRASSSSTPVTSHHHTRSLPTTPRMSTVSRRSIDNTDHHHHHRLSLQINKENYNNSNSNSNNNNNVGQRHSDIMVNRQVDHLKTQYAKEITNQVRERISRRLGTDITNTLSTAKSIDRRRDSDLVLLKPKKDPTVKLSKPVKDEKIKRIASEIRYDLRLKNTTKKKSTALPKHVLNVKNTTKVGCYKREMTSSSSTARSSQLKVSLPSKLNSSYKDVTHKPTTSTITTTFSTSAAKGGSILQRLIEGDMGRSTRKLLATAYATEAEDIVKEMENEIMENLVLEIVMGGGTC